MGHFRKFMNYQFGLEKGMKYLKIVEINYINFYIPKYAPVNDATFSKKCCSVMLSPHKRLKIMI